MGDCNPQANQILGMAPGEVFVQRNVGNQALHTDMNVMSCLERAVKTLKVGAWQLTSNNTNINL